MPSDNSELTSESHNNLSLSKSTPIMTLTTFLNMKKKESSVKKKSQGPTMKYNRYASANSEVRGNTSSSGGSSARSSEGNKPLPHSYGARRRSSTTMTMKYNRCPSNMLANTSSKRTGHTSSNRIAPYIQTGPTKKIEYRSSKIDQSLLKKSSSSKTHLGADNSLYSTTTTLSAAPTYRAPLTTSSLEKYNSLHRHISGMEAYSVSTSLIMRGATDTTSASSSEDGRTTASWSDDVRKHRAGESKLSNTSSGKNSSSSTDSMRVGMMKKSERSRSSSGRGMSSASGLSGGKKYSNSAALASLMSRGRRLDSRTSSRSSSRRGANWRKMYNITDLSTVLEETEIQFKLSPEIPYLLPTDQSAGVQSAEAPGIIMGEAVVADVEVEECSLSTVSDDGVISSCII